jgi:hypothetical protein
MRAATLIALPIMAALSACVADQGAVEDYAFVGTWNCEVDVFTFTNSSYNNGTETFPIERVDRDGRNYTLFFAKGYVVALAAVTETGLTWVSGATGDQFNCLRVK